MGAFLCIALALQELKERRAALGVGVVVFGLIPAAWKHLVRLVRPLLRHRPT
jgi:hypothetical protein